MLSPLFFQFCFFVLGTIVGSFLNVLVLRYNTGVSVVRGRSFCFSCGKKLSWLELIPVISFIIQKGKCRGCKSKISWQYPLVECLSGLLFLGVFLKYSDLNTLSENIISIVIALILMSLLVSITIYDIKHKIIPDGLVFTFAILALLKIFLENDQWSWFLAAGPILALPLFLIWLFSRGRLMGLGDPKLVLCIGWFLGPILGLSAVVLAFWAGAIYGLVLIILSKYHWHGLNINRQSELPFAPFLVLGFLVVYFFNIDVLRTALLTP